MMSKLILIIPVLLLISACNQQPQSSLQSGVAQIQKVETSKHAPATFQTTKSHAAISMKYSILDDIVLDQSFAVKLSFKVGRDTEYLQIEFSPEPGLILNGGQNSYLFNKLAKGDVETFDLSVKPELAGELAINVTATIDVHGVQQSRSFQIPVNLDSNDSLLEKTNAQQSNKQQTGVKFLPAENIISMPATETTQ